MCECVCVRPGDRLSCQQSPPHPCLPSSSASDRQRATFLNHNASDTQRGSGWRSVAAGQKEGYSTVNRVQTAGFLAASSPKRVPASRPRVTLHAYTHLLTQAIAQLEPFTVPCSRFYRMFTLLCKSADTWILSLWEWLMVNVRSFISAECYIVSPCGDLCKSCLKCFSSRVFCYYKLYIELRYSNFLSIPALKIACQLELWHAVLYPKVIGNYKAQPQRVHCFDCKEEVGASVPYSSICYDSFYVCRVFSFIGTTMNKSCHKTHAAMLITTIPPLQHMLLVLWLAFILFIFIDPQCGWRFICGFICLSIHFFFITSLDCIWAWLF